MVEKAAFDHGLGVAVGIPEPRRSARETADPVLETEDFLGEREENRLGRLVPMPAAVERSGVPQDKSRLGEMRTDQSSSNYLTEPRFGVMAYAALCFAYGSY